MVVYTVYADDILIHHSESSSPEVKLITPKLSMEENSSGSFTFTVPPSNVGYNYITRITTEIIVKRQTVDSQTGLLGKEKEIWSGRVIDEKTDFFNNRQMTCEGALSYLNDTIQPQAKYERYTPASMLTTLINNHNDKSVPFIKKGLTIIFDSKCKTENSFDYIRIYYRNSSNTYDYIQAMGDIGAKEINIPENDFYLYWHTDSSVHDYYGYRIESISPYGGTEYTTKTGTGSLPSYTPITVGLNNLPESAHNPYQDNANELYFVQTGYGRAYDHDFRVGAVTVQDPDPSVGYTDYETNFESTMDCVNSKLLNTCGGHLVLRRDETNGYNYIDYLEEYTKLNNQTIEFGKNLLDFSKSFDISSICTVLIPLGKRLEAEVDDDMDSYLTVESVNSGLMYVVNQEALNTFGWIEKVEHFDDIEDASILLRRAQRYLQDTQFEQMTLELSAVDMHYLGVDDGELFELYDRVHCTSKPHGLDREFPIKKIEIPLDNPENTTFTIGDNVVANTLSSTLSNTNRTINSKIDSLPSTTSVLKEAKQNADQIMRQLTNGYITTIIEGTDVNAHSEALIISDNVDYTQSNRYWKWNLNGLAYYRNKTELGLALTMDGTIVADRILTGTLGKPEWGNYWNMQTGEFILSPGKVKTGSTTYYEHVVVRFDSQSSSESLSYDWVDVVWKNENGTYSYVRRGGYGSTWAEVYIPKVYNGELYIYWRSDSSQHDYNGFRVNSITSYSSGSATTPTGTRTTILPSGDIALNIYTVPSANAYSNIKTTNFPSSYTDGERKLWTIVINGITPKEATLENYTQGKVNDLDDSLNQESVFNRLTNNGTVQGIQMSGGQLYINASYINTGTMSANLIKGGTLKDQQENMTWDMNNGTLTAKKLTIDTPYFNLSEYGYITSRENRNETGSKTTLSQGSLNFYHDGNWVGGIYGNYDGSFRELNISANNVSINGTLAQSTDTCWTRASNGQVMSITFQNGFFTGYSLSGSQRSLVSNLSFGDYSSFVSDLSDNGGGYWSWTWRSALTSASWDNVQ